MPKWKMMVIVLATVSFIGCAETEDLTWYRDHYNRQCEHIFAEYRNHQPKPGGMIPNLHETEHYFRVRLGNMTVNELKALLGEPRIVTPKDSYYIDALGPLYDYAMVGNPNWRSGNKHDLVLHYGEEGPPHWIPDESTNFFFIAKDGVIISLWVLS